MVDKPKADEPKRPTQAPLHNAPQPAAGGRIQGVGAGQPRDEQPHRSITSDSRNDERRQHVADAGAPAQRPEMMSDHDRTRLDELRGMAPAHMPERTPQQEAEFVELERREREALWAAQDARVAELQAKVLTPDEERELQDLQMTIDNQRRADVRRGEPQP